LYLTTINHPPIFIKAISVWEDWRSEKKKEPKADDDLVSGSLFFRHRTNSRRCLAGVVVALLRE
jgi:hypothetical protein